METLLIAIGAMALYLIAYHTYGRWLARKIFRLDPAAAVPSVELNDDRDFVPTAKGVVFGHHFTSIAGTGPIVGPAIAVMWGWLPALLWVLIGSVFIGAVHDFGALVVSLRNRGQTVGDIAGRVLNPRVRLLFLCILFMALTVVLAIFGLVIAAVFRKYPASIFPCLVQIPLAMGIGVWLHRRGVGLFVPSLIALAVMYLTVIYGDEGFLGAFNETLSNWSALTWCFVLLGYSYVASVLPVWTLLQPRDYINSLQLLSALGLIVAGLVCAALLGGAPLADGGARPTLEIVAPMVDLDPEGAPFIFPFLFITIACGACSGFHCLVSSGTSSKQLERETDAQFVAYGSMLTEGFLATLVILACVAGLGLGIAGDGGVLAGHEAWAARYTSWQGANSLGAKVGAFVDGAANFLRAMGIPATTAVALMGVLVASFAATTLDTACRLERYVIQELASTFLKRKSPTERADETAPGGWNPILVLRNKHAATIFAVVLAGVLAALPPEAAPIGLVEAWTGEVTAPAAAAAAAANVPAEAIESMGAGGAAGAWSWLASFGGKGGLILWPLFGATNQLLAGLAFLVISFWMWRRSVPLWFIALPMVFMLIVPGAAMVWQLGGWIEAGKYTLVLIGVATLALEAWMVAEALLMWPRVRGVLEDALPPLGPRTTLAAAKPQGDGGRSC